MVTSSSTLTAPSNGEQAPEQVPLTQTQVGILKDIQALRIDLDRISGWMREQLAQILFRDGPILIDVQGPSVFLTEDGQEALRLCTVSHSDDRVQDSNSGAGA